MATEAQPLEPVDVEELLSRDISTDACPAQPPPVPESLGGTLPLAMVERDGGTRLNAVVDSHNVTVSVWACTWADAMREANRIAGAIARLPMEPGASTQWRTATITLLPFNAPDSAHPTIPRVQLAASVTCRATT